MKMNIEIIVFDHDEIEAIDYRPALKVFNKTVKPEELDGPIIFGEHYNHYSMTDYMKKHKLLWCPVFNNFTNLNTMLTANIEANHRKFA